MTPRDDGALVDAEIGPAIKAAKAAKKRRDISDGKVEGLQLRIGASGKATWSLAYRFHGQRERMTIGRPYPTTSLKDARRLAKARLQAVAEGKNPKAAASADLTMATLLGTTGPLVDGRLPKADEDPGWYLATYCATAGKKRGDKLVSKTAAGIAAERYQIAKHLRTNAALMRKRPGDVTSDMLDSIKKDLPPSVWRRLRGVLVICFARAVKLHAAETNPAKETSAQTDGSRERYLTDDERKRLESVLVKGESDGAHAGGWSASVLRAVRIAILTAMRQAEVRTLRWTWIDLEGATITLPASKTGRKVVPLTPHAVQFFRELGGGTGLVCPAANGRPISKENLGRAWRSIRKRAKLDGSDGKEPVRFHDLRHSWASDAVSAGVSLSAIGKVLGHSRVTTTARYSHMKGDALARELKLAGDAIANATSVPAKR